MEKPVDRLRKLMNLYNIRQADIIKETGISSSCLSSYLSGKREPKSDKMYLIAKAFRVNPMWLMGFDVEMKSEDIDRGSILAKLSNSKNLDLFLQIDDLNPENVQMLRSLVQSWKK